MSKIWKFLFPEYQIIETMKEKGFWAKQEKPQQYMSQVQTSSRGQVQEQVQEQIATRPIPSMGDQVTVEGPSQPYTPAKQPTPASVAFDNITRQLPAYWVGSEADQKGLIKAFQRPYVSGFNQVQPRNTILLLGSESRGKVYAMECIAKLLQQQKVFTYESVAKVDFKRYGVDTDNMLFLGDLYQALNSDTEITIFENVEAATLSQLEILYQLIHEGIYRLPKRYMRNDGGLVEATGLLNVGLVSELLANGKFFVLTSTESKGAVISKLGHKIATLIGDVIILEPLTEAHIRQVSYTLLTNMVKQVHRNLRAQLTFTEGCLAQVMASYVLKTGVKGIRDYIEEVIYQPLAEMKLQNQLVDGETITLDYRDGFTLYRANGTWSSLADYTKTFSSAELEEVKAELAQVIGLEKVKAYILGLEDNVAVQKLRERRGYRSAQVAMHMVFTGNPGTGKTTVARIVAKYLKALGVVSSGHLSEVTRTDLVGQYVGHTAKKTQEVIEGALGGVLFIDEAYALCRDKEDSFGLEAIDALVKGMEDHRDDLVVILAGYDKEMANFLELNPGLKSRFPNQIHFDDYTPTEMYTIAGMIAKGKGYQIDDDCEEGLLALFEKSQIKGRNDSGNGRLVRNIIEGAIIKQSQRILKESDSDLARLTKEDFGLTKIENFDLEAELAKVVGMAAVKDMIRQQYRLLQANQKRKNANIEVDVTQSLHMIFAGNPGTGKTMMARMMARMFQAMGVLKRGHLVETDKSGLVASYVGQTAPKTEAIFKSALGGILFIDEAYALTNDGNSFGQEAVDTLVKLMEDYRGEIVVVLAGYTKEMKDFLKSNSGLSSRFPLHMEFPDYTPQELVLIGQRMIASKGFQLDSTAVDVFADGIANKARHMTASSGNGRMVRNYIEEIIRKQSARIALSDVSPTELTTIIADDIAYQSISTQAFDLEQALAKVVGLDQVKSYIRSLNARLKIQESRKEQGLKVNTSQTMHMIFTGNPGTGKTMMARIVADVLYHMGVIGTNKLVEIDRSGLVAGYVGQTAIKTREVVESALDGVLFVDEAYALASGGAQDFGREAIDTLVKMMDDYRDRLVVILAGYSDDMAHLLQTNAGLTSRFPNIIHFPDYTTDELMTIILGMYHDQGYVITSEAHQQLVAHIEVAKRNPQFGNGRYVRNVFERSLNAQALRLSTDTDLTKAELMTITGEDIGEGE